MESSFVVAKSIHTIVSDSERETARGEHGKHV